MTVDLSIIIGFLIINLIIGLGHGQRKIRTIKDYALGDGKFSTGAVVATTVATTVSASSLVFILSGVYSRGLSHLIGVTGTGISFIIVVLLSSKMKEFLGKNSIAEALGDLYGNRVRLITAIAGIIGSAGFVASQYRVIGSIFASLFDFSQYNIIIATGIITIIYSAFGGIRAVIFTDIVQFLTFGVIIPIIGLITWHHFVSEEFTLTQAIFDLTFELNFVSGITNSLSFEVLILLIYFSIPGFNAPEFQRVAIARDVKQVKKAFLIASIFIILVDIMIAWIPFLINVMGYSITDNQIFNYIVNKHNYLGFRGVIVIAVIALSMSTADSHINSASILFTNDICKLYMKKFKNEIFISRVFVVCFGGASIILSLVSSGLFSIILLAGSFYYPLVSPPFLLAVIGFRSSSKAVLIGMTSGLVFTIIWKLLPPYFDDVIQMVIGVLLAMSCNTCAVFVSHYVLKQKGGWINSKNQQPLYIQKIQQKQSILVRFVHIINNFNIRNHFKKLLPENDTTYTLLGIYLIVYTITTMYSVHMELFQKHIESLLSIYQFMLVISVSMLAYPSWSGGMKRKMKEEIIPILWVLIIFYMLSFLNGLFVILSNFSLLQVSLFIINIIIAIIFLGWRLNLITIPLGLYLSIICYQIYFDEYSFNVNLGSKEFVLLYVTLVTTIIFITFFKSKEDSIELFKQKTNVLEQELEDLNEKIYQFTNDKIQELNAINFTPSVNHYLNYQTMQKIYQKSLNTINNTSFTPREIDVMSCIFNLRGAKKIANILFISPKTVNVHVQHVISKIGGNSQESIIDFVEKSGYSQNFRHYYYLLLIESVFFKSVEEIGRKNKNKKIFYTAGCSNMNNEEKAILKRIKKNLELANVFIEKKIKYSEVNLELINNFSNVNKPQVRNNIYILLNKNINDNILTEISYIDFCQESKYYQSVFELLEKILDIDLSQITQIFEEQYQSILDSVGKV
ncbi:MAG: hypothetical protein HRU35_07090 [Rickettsiaceae bacterium]|nr:hypothetical protein [Rickettsiaceae bacterium]